MGKQAEARHVLPSRVRSGMLALGDLGGLEVFWGKRGTKRTVIPRSVLLRRVWIIWRPAPLDSAGRGVSEF